MFMYMYVCILHTCYREIPLDSVKWVITVPAIWSNRAKTFIREAAVKAGLVEEEQSPRLLVILEAIAAARYCKSMGTRCQHHKLHSAKLFYNS